MDGETQYDSNHPLYCYHWRNYRISVMNQEISCFFSDIPENISQLYSLSEECKTEENLQVLEDFIQTHLSSLLSFKDNQDNNVFHYCTSNRLYPAIQGFTNIFLHLRTDEVLNRYHIELMRMLYKGKNSLNLDPVHILCILAAKTIHSPISVQKDTALSLEKYTVLTSLFSSGVLTQSEFENTDISQDGNKHSFSSDNYLSLALINSDLRLARSLVQKYRDLRDFRTDKELNLFHYLSFSDPVKFQSRKLGEKYQSDIFQTLVDHYSYDQNNNQRSSRTTKVLTEIGNKLSTLQICIFFNNYNLFKIMLKAAPQLRTTSSTTTQLTPIFACCRANFPKYKDESRERFLRLLLNLDKQPNLVHDADETESILSSDSTITVAGESRYALKKQEIEDIINHKSTAFNYTPIMTCMLRDHRNEHTFRIAKLLLELGCELSHEGSDTFSAITISLFYLDYEALNLLLTYGRFKTNNEQSFNPFKDRRQFLRLRIGKTFSKENHTRSIVTLRSATSDASAFSKLENVDFDAFSTKATNGSSGRLTDEDVYDLTVSHGQQGFPYSYAWKRIRSVNAVDDRNFAKSRFDLSILDLLASSGAILRTKIFPATRRQRHTNQQDFPFSWIYFYQHFGFAFHRFARNGSKLDMQLLTKFVEHISQYRIDGTWKSGEDLMQPLTNQMKNCPHSIMSLSILFGDISLLKLCLSSPLINKPGKKKLKRNIDLSICLKKPKRLKFYNSYIRADRKYKLNYYLKLTTQIEEEVQAFCVVCSQSFSRHHGKVGFLSCSCIEAQHTQEDDCRGSYLICEDCTYLDHSLGKGQVYSSFSLKKLAMKKESSPALVNYVNMVYSDIGAMLYDVGLTCYLDLFLDAGFTQFGSWSCFDSEVLQQIGIENFTDRETIIRKLEKI
eukprot:snap_masked-scaffold_48-processed-gene-0.16-mRNA-1 protein AED:1.00 eAED:1.00 QI:0/-1/0/0/-1/1/1/0/899